jgi:hypothetical protein
MKPAMRITLAVSAVVSAVVALAGCAAAPTEPPAPVAQVAAAPKPLEISETSFGCIRDMKAVRGFYVGNLLGNVDATLAAANNPEGGAYPPGSVVQLVPGEAMVKHHPGYDAATNDWEFFELDVKPNQPTKIRVRGTTQVVNQFGGNCLSCHAPAAQKWDMICEQTHGCLPIPVTPVMARAIQKTDPRCAPTALADDEKAALAQLMAFLAASAPKAQ